MKLGHKNVHSHWIALSALIAYIVGSSAMAAPGAISTKPLILETTPVQPNIFFLVDDSGSMNWEDLLNAGTEFPATAPVSTLYFSPDNALEKRLLCRGFNVMAYDPDVTYEPWAGVDSANNAYSNLTLTTARDNPYSTTVTDISGHVYVTWTDSDSDGEYDGPGSTDIDSSSSTGDECDISNPVSVSTLTTAQKQNYANWYSYYRKREYVAKRALSQIIKDSSSRIGLGTLHNHNSVRTVVKDIDDITIPVDATARTNKNNLLDNLFNIDSSNGTPLRTALEDVGEYFAGNMSASWGASPILSSANGGQCQKNFAIVMSDGFWNGNNPGVGNTDNGNGPWDGGSHADNVSNTLADVAMKYYETDLDTTLENKVGKIPGIDENTAQHLVTYTVAFGVNGTLTANPPNRTDAFSWPTPVSNESTTIDDMRHAAWNGRGQFLSAGNPQKLINSLKNAIKDIDSRSGTSAAAALNTTSLQTDSLIFMASYNSTGWLGNLSAIEIGQDGTLGSLKWEANQKLTEISSADLQTTRKIYTYDGTSAKLFNSLNLTADQKADLLVGKPAAETDSAYLSRIIKFIYGDHADEAGGAGLQYFRNRADQRLGDIVHSAPQYVGVPSTPYPDTIEGTNLYSTFKASQDSRDGTVYVGSNDGMLHAFNAKTGAERFAYIPNMMFSTEATKGLHALANPVYGHNYYVDLTPAVADVYVGGWKTMLVGGLRGGGKGIFALDVTTEGSMSVQFEFTHADLGYTFSEIQIAKMNNGKWAAVFGNGYNNTGDGKAKLFIVYLDNSGSKIIDTTVGSVSNSDCADAGSDCNGLSTPALADLNGDGKVDRIYAGDVQGNMWSFNVSDPSDANWTTAYGTEPLFIACRAAGTTCDAADRQPITSKPALARHPDQRSAATYTNIMVMFGTGQFITSGDVTNTTSQSVYGIWDRGDSDLTRSDLVQQTISSSVSKDALPIRVSTDLSVNYTSDVDTTDHGWYFNLPTQKERVVVNPVAYGDLLFINTMIPESPQVCDNSGGTGWLMAVDIYNGGEPDFAPLDVNDDAVFDDKDGNTSDVLAVGTKIDGIPTESKFVSDKRITVDSNKNVNVESVQGVPPGTPSRMSWTSL
ncbi:pilus assembly protein [Kaarinaea lacus]